MQIGLLLRKFILAIKGIRFSSIGLDFSLISDWALIASDGLILNGRGAGGEPMYTPL